MTAAAVGRCREHNTLLGHWPLHLTSHGIISGFVPGVPLWKSPIPLQKLCIQVSHLQSPYPVNLKEMRRPTAAPSLLDQGQNCIISKDSLH